MLQPPLDHYASSLHPPFLINHNDRTPAITGETAVNAGATVE